MSEIDKRKVQDAIVLAEKMYAIVMQVFDGDKNTIKQHANELTKLCWKALREASNSEYSRPEEKEKIILKNFFRFFLATLLGGRLHRTISLVTQF